MGLSWLTLLLVLALPVTVGRCLLRYILAVSSPRISDDFVPLSLGVVMLSVATLGAVKTWEALHAVVSRAAAFERGRRARRLLACTCSFVALAVMALIVFPVGLGMLTLRLFLPLKAPSVYQMPVVFLATDCWSLGLFLCKMLSRLVQTDTVWHELHQEGMAVWTEVQGSLTSLFFDLSAHVRVWRAIVLPLLEAVVLYLVFPGTLARTLVWYVVPEEQLYVRAFLMMYCYHIVLAIRIWSIVFPTAKSWLDGVRQSIFDAKYLVSTELQNYHPVDVAQAAGLASQE